MVKRLYTACISLKYNFFLLGFTTALFAAAMLYANSRSQSAKGFLIFFTVLLVIAMVLFYTERIRMGLQLRKVNNIKEFDDGMTYGYVVFAAMRLLAYQKRRVLEIPYSRIATLTKQDGKHGRIELLLETPDAKVRVPLFTPEDAQLLANFLCTQNPGIATVNIQPTGSALLKDLFN